MTKVYMLYESDTYAYPAASTAKHKSRYFWNTPHLIAPFASYDAAMAYVSETVPSWSWYWYTNDMGIQEAINGEGTPGGLRYQIVETEVQS